jgi:LAO/AO transport system kinase
LNTAELLQQIKGGDYKALARAISIVENETGGFEEILFSLNAEANAPVIGITGPPGAGKSTLINALAKHLSSAGKKIAIVAVDPTSPFNYGSLLGDRLRMSELFTEQNIFIRSLATRGSLGGLSEKIIEVVDVLQAADFDYIIVETVGVGQSEVEIAGLADTTVVVFVPESGDEVQTMKSGIMEIADIFVVNKCDREGADMFAKNLQQLVHEHALSNWQVPVIKTSASQKQGIKELADEIEKHSGHFVSNDKKIFLLTEKAYRLSAKNRMKDISRQKIQEDIRSKISQKDFNLYTLVKSYSQK